MNILARIIIEVTIEINGFWEIIRAERTYWVARRALGGVLG